VLWCCAAVQCSVLVTADGEQAQGENVVLYFGIIDILQVRMLCLGFRVYPKPQTNLYICSLVVRVLILCYLLLSLWYFCMYLQKLAAVLDSKL
jgi:hypothetical protein